jgi:hypothetical protein
MFIDNVLGYVSLINFMDETYGWYSRINVNVFGYGYD